MHVFSSFSEAHLLEILGLCLCSHNSSGMATAGLRLVEVKFPQGGHEGEGKDHGVVGRVQGCGLLFAGQWAAREGLVWSHLTLLPSRSVPIPLQPRVSPVCCLLWNPSRQKWGRLQNALQEQYYTQLNIKWVNATKVWFGERRLGVLLDCCLRLPNSVGILYSCPREAVSLGSHGIAGSVSDAPAGYERVKRFISILCFVNVFKKSPSPPLALPEAVWWHQHGDELEQGKAAIPAKSPVALHEACHGGWLLASSAQDKTWHGGISGSVCPAGPIGPGSLQPTLCSKEEAGKARLHLSTAGTIASY